MAAASKRSLLTERDFLLVSLAVGLSAMGDWVAITALGLHVEEMTDNGYAVAALWICLFGPSVAVAGHAGLLVDRVEATRLLALVSALGAVGAAALAFVDALAPVLVLTAALGVVFALMQPAEFSLIPVLAGTPGPGGERPRRDLPLPRLRDRPDRRRLPVRGRRPGAGDGRRRRHLRRGRGGRALPAGAPRAAADADGDEERAREGIAYLFRDRTLSLVMIVAFSSLLFMSAVWVGELFFVKDVLDQGDTAYGVFLSVWTAGMAIGALFLSKRVAAGAVAAVGLAAATIQGAALAAPHPVARPRVLPRLLVRRRASGMVSRT